MVGKKRLQFDFTEDALEELDGLQRATGAPSRAELIRHSLRLLQWMVDEAHNKKGTFLVERDGKLRELVLLPFIGNPTQVSATVSAGNNNEEELVDQH